MVLIKEHWPGPKVIFSKEKIYIENHNGYQISTWNLLCCPTSILGPLLNLIYVNDFYFASELKNVMIADDTNLFISKENAGALLQQMNKELKGVSAWFKANKLSTILIKPNGLFFIPLYPIFIARIALERATIP